MVASTLEFPQYEQLSAAQPVKIKPYPELSGDENHEVEQPMTKAENDLFELRQDIHNIAASVALQVKTQEQLSASVAVLVQAQSKQPVVASNGNKWTGWIQTGVICGMLLVSGTNTFKTSESDLRAEVREAKNAAAEAKRDAGDAAKEAKKANLNNALLDTYNRELERALIKKGVALPSYPILEK